MGLTISRSLCELLGYRQEVESEVNRGTTFRVVLGDAPAVSFLAPITDHTIRLPDETIGQWTGTRVLVIDDDADSRLLLRQYLEEFGCTVAAARSGAEGLQLAREFRPRLIALDLLMPEMDGLQVMKVLKSDPELGHIPVVIVSIVATERRGSVLGAADYLDKPVPRESILTMLRRNFPQDRGPVLVVEDDPDLRTLLTVTLESEGFRVEAASNGAEALKALAEVPPTLIILDLRMPVMDGWSFLEHVRHRPGPRPSIIVITAGDLTPDQVARLHSQATAVLRKEGEFVQDLKIAVEAVLEKETAKSGAG